MKDKKTIEITKEQFDAYRKVQFSGVTNMWLVSTVKELSGLPEGICFEIMESYGELELKYGKYNEEDK